MTLYDLTAHCLRLLIVMLVVGCSQQSAPVKQCREIMEDIPIYGTVTFQLLYHYPANNGIIADIGEFNRTVIQVSETFVATVEFQGSLASYDWKPLACFTLVGKSVASMISPGIVRCNTSGIRYVRAVIPHYTSGHIDVSMLAYLVKTEKWKECTDVKP